LRRVKLLKAVTLPVLVLSAFAVPQASANATFSSKALMHNTFCRFEFAIVHSFATKCSFTILDYVQEPERISKGIVKGHASDE
jgi:hypothetical protein